MLMARAAKRRGYCNSSCELICIGLLEAKVMLDISEI